MALRPLVSARFQVLFTPLTGVLFTFRSRYSCAIGRRGVLSLGRSSSRIHAGFHVTGDTWVVRARAKPFVYRAITFYGGPFQGLQLSLALLTRCAPRGGRRGLPRPRMRNAHELARISVWADPRSLAATRGVEFLSFPGGTEMFQFPPFPPPTYVFGRRLRGMTPGTFPHLRDPRINACLRLPGAFRS